MFRKETIYTIHSFGIINSRISDSEIIPVQNRNLYQTCCKDSNFKDNVIKLFQQSTKYFIKDTKYKSEITECLIPVMIRSFDKHLSKFDILYFIDKKVLKPEILYKCMIKELYNVTYKDYSKQNLTFDDYFLMLMWSIDCVLSKFTFIGLDKFTNFSSSMIWKLYNSIL